MRSYNLYRRLFILYDHKLYYLYRKKIIFLKYLQFIIKF